MENRKGNNIFEASEAIRTKMSSSGLNFEDTTDFLSFMRLVRSGEVTISF